MNRGKLPQQKEKKYKERKKYPKLSLGRGGSSLPTGKGIEGLAAFFSWATA